MPDMLVKLYELPEYYTLIEELKEKGIEIRRALPPERHVVIGWVKENFGEAWASECDTAFARQPVSCFIATQNQKLTGFACYEATCKDFFGPTGVDKTYRGLGIGKALLLICLHAMKELGYAYAIIGGAGPVEFYKKAINAVEIPGSVPGIYRGMLKSGVKSKINSVRRFIKRTL